ncbi:MAG: hypothetical protein F6K19_13565 [Cyanothece sp. SIO1E1]|nr:hypothetical protein [Cyanothece sp. SIO1E1]
MASGKLSFSTLWVELRFSDKTPSEKAEIVHVSGTFFQNLKEIKFNADRWDYTQDLMLDFQNKSHRSLCRRLIDVCFADIPANLQEETVEIIEYSCLLLLEQFVNTEGIVDKSFAELDELTERIEIKLKSSLESQLVSDIMDFLTKVEWETKKLLFSPNC